MEQETKTLVKPKYPKYPWSMDKRRKLTEQNIKDIRLLYKQGHSQSKLGRMFCVSRTIIRYYVDEAYNKLHKIENREYDNHRLDVEQRKINHNNMSRRKRRLMTMEIREYDRNIKKLKRRERKNGNLQ